MSQVLRRAGLAVAVTTEVHREHVVERLGPIPVMFKFSRPERRWVPLHYVVGEPVRRFPDQSG